MNKLFTHAIAFSNKRRLTRRLCRGIDMMMETPVDRLRDPEVVADLIRTVGLTYDSRNVYFKDNIHMIPPDDCRPHIHEANYHIGMGGMWQIPDQMGACLVELSRHRIARFLEVGTWQGWTFSFMTAYLSRFNPGLQAISCDPARHFFSYANVRKTIPLTFHLGSSRDFAGQSFDLCFIDGNHHYDFVKRDYEQVGQNSRLVMFHDVVDAHCPGVVRLWGELKEQLSGKAAFQVFDGGLRETMGIGLCIHHPSC